MNQDVDLLCTIQAIIKKIQDCLKRFQHQPNQLHKLIAQWLDLSSDYLTLFLLLFKEPKLIQQMQINWWQDATRLLQDQLTNCLEGTTIPLNDKRFSAKEWVNNPFFNFLGQYYLLTSEHVSSLLDRIDYGDKQLAHRLQFFTKQFLDAFSPDNFIHTNPHLMAETLQSHGKNLLLGLNNFLSDIEAGSSRLVMTMIDRNALIGNLINSCHSMISSYNKNSC